MTNVQKIILFLNAVEWCTATNIAILLYGVNNPRNINAAKGQLHAMLKTREPQIKKPHCKYGATFAIKDSKKKEIGTFKYNHDAELRNCLAKFLYDRDYKGMEDLTTRWDDKDADGVLWGDLYFELDNGGMDDWQLTDKLAKHYISRGKFRVVFFMVAKYDISHLEENRLKKLFEVSNLNYS